MLAVGRLQAQKGFDLLLRAWQTVLQQMPDGAAADRRRRPARQPSSRALASDARRRGQRRAGRRRPRRIETLYREAAVFVLSSRYEGMPLALLEAQALGVPAVAFDCPTGPREILSEATGMLVAGRRLPALAAAICACCATGARARAWPRRRSRASRGFQPRAQVDAWATLIDEVAAAACALAGAA